MVQRLQAEQEHDEQESGTRQRIVSSVAFPYGDLRDAIQVAKTLCDRNGYTFCSREQLSAWLGHDSSISGSFRLRLSAAKLFGLIEMGQDSVKLTTLGREILDQSQERAARVQAFLNVPLYSKLYERFKSYPLPSAIGIEQEMVDLGVSPKQKAKARQAFQRSAEQAGFLDESPSRLVMPGGLGTPNSVSRDTKPLTPSQSPVISTPPAQHNHGGSGGGSNGLAVLQEHPLIQGLYQLLPSVGSPMTETQRKEWLALAELILKKLYPENQQE